jgi:guanylate kinase
MDIVLQRLADVAQLPTATTRERRDNETEGVQHFFYNRADFQQLIDNNALLEHQVVHEELYGIVRARVEEALAEERDLIADIEVLGASILKDTYPNNAILIFVSPPDRATLENRIRSRGADDEQKMNIRLQRTPFEMQFAAMCKYLIVNNDLEQAADELLNVIQAERRQRDIRRFINVTARIYADGQLLIRQGASPDDLAALPQTIVWQGESPLQAINRLAVDLGVAPITVIKPVASPVDDLGPSDYELFCAGQQPRLNLIYECTVQAGRELIPGWEWHAAEPVSEG